MLDNPKKKSKMWTSISDELKAVGIEVKQTLLISVDYV